MSLRLVGRAFHSLGATLEKARSPKVTRFVRGTHNSLATVERVTRGVSLIDNSSCRYAGAMPFRHFHVSNNTLNMILLSTGSQCKERRASVMWSLFLRLRIVRAAIFCTFCRSWMFFAVQADQDKTKNKIRIHKFQ